MARINRRTALKISGAGALAATTGGGMAAILASGRAPAYAQATTVHWLRWADFVPASDVLLKGEITAECQKALGIKLTVETINANDTGARHFVGPVWDGPRHHKSAQQLGASLRR
jgi:multiple sugar transport system substrate-binding protein